MSLMIVLNAVSQILDVISSEEHIDLVSSTAELSLHIDNCHLEAPPGLVMLHCLRYIEQAIL